ncbi:MAG: hypothetical protein U5N86_06800 [Planctomycetota bacterium]|nr:hypothetical protein [Planctomycetota bacterium]
MFSRKSLVALLLVFVLFFVVPVIGELENKCETCGGDGKLVDKECPEPYPYKSTFAFEKFEGHGFGFTVCPDCLGAQAEWDRLVKDYKEWEKERRERIDQWVFGDEAGKHKVHHVESDHFVVCGTFKGSTDWNGRRTTRMSAMERSENYLRLTEKIYSEQFLKLLDLENYEPEEKWEITIWSGPGEIEKASNRLIGNTQTCISTFQGRLITTPDSSGESHYQSIIYNLFYCIIQEYKGFVDGGLPDWFWDAYAHYVELAVFGRVANNMSDEALGGSGSLSGSNFGKRLKVLARRGKCPDVIQFNSKNVGRLLYQEQMMAWGIIDWIYREYGGDKLQLWIEVAKRTRSAGMAFKDSIGIPISEVKEEFEKWAIKNY